MKSLTIILLIGLLAIPAIAEESKTNSAPEATATNPPPAAIAIPLTSGKITAPFVLTNGVLSQPEQTEVEGGGKATFDFTVADEGDYVFVTQANAADESSNSFFINVDAPPQDPMMIWDMDVTSGFAERIANWRGNGDSGADEFSPKKFHLAVGAHKLFLVGREPTQLKSIAIRAAGK